MSGVSRCVTNTKDGAYCDVTTGRRRQSTYLIRVVDLNFTLIESCSTTRFYWKRQEWPGGAPLLPNHRRGFSKAEKDDDAQFAGQVSLRHPSDSQPILDLAQVDKERGQVALHPLGTPAR